MQGIVFNFLGVNKNPVRGAVTAAAASRAQAKDFSDSMRFGEKQRQQAVLRLDATGTRLDIVFTPHGRPAAVAEVVIRENLERGGE